MASAEQTKIRGCKICGISAMRMIEPRRLPCGHIYCRLCLSQMSDSMKLTCKECGEKTDTEVGDLPLDYGKDFSCDPCSRKGKMSQAKLFCKFCKQKMCETHIEGADAMLQSHDDLDHSMIPVEAALSADEGDSCSTHPTHELISSCSECLQVFCLMCLDDESLCAGEVPHNVRTISRVSANSKRRLTALINECEKRGKSLEKLIYQAKGVRDEMQTKVAYELSKVTERRDAQLQEIREKYDLMEKKIRDEFHRSRDELDEYLQILIQQNKLPLQELAAELKENILSRNQAHLVRRTSRLVPATESMVSTQLPEISVRNILAIQLLDQTHRKMELDLVDTGVIKVHDATSSPPISLTFSHTVPTRSSCYSVCHWENKLLMGAGNGVDLIENGKSTALISLDELVTCVHIIDQRLFLLHKNQEDCWAIGEYRLDGKIVNKWYHKDSCSDPNQFVIHNEILYVPSRSESCIKLYTLSGHSAGSNIDIVLSGTFTTLCVTPAKRLVLSQYDPSRIVCVRPVKGEQIWCRRDLVYPDAVTSDNHRHLLVAVGGDSETVSIEVLKEDTGETVTRFGDSVTRPEAAVWDLSVSDMDMLVAARGDKIYFYQLEREDNCE